MTKQGNDPYDRYISQTLHVCHICLHWALKPPPCRHIWHMAYMECLSIDTDTLGYRILKASFRSSFQWVVPVRHVFCQWTRTTMPGAEELMSFICLHLYEVTKRKTYKKKQPGSLVDKAVNEFKKQSLTLRTSWSNLKSSVSTGGNA